MKKTIYENKQIKVTTTGQDYDFIATIENKTNDKIIIKCVDDKYLNDITKQIASYKIEIPPADWVGLMYCETDLQWIEAFEDKKIEVLRG